MWDRSAFEPVFFAPFVSSPLKIETEWMDYNGHVNMAYYNVLFDRATDEAMALIGLGPHYAEARRASFFTAETHVRYLRELPNVGTVRATVQLVDYDEKRLHLFLQLHHGSDGWISACCELVALHVDLATRRVVPFPDEILERIAGMKAVHGALPIPDGLGRSVAMSPRC
ncbi:thioesterase family protein [Aquabacter spiritensis]|uniref:(3S)-malyl-CoA thioesterase n=1 Tax=Aquabacter spiritensis TaxID=933073 RepID=A0A4R3M2C3_9HYPH|nr:thioesterase family protein [Aquabacter spiritensis]TCT06846.1 (3S)-malyl-CoA thioesterase [Aquabacter spiritensis]